MNAFGGEAEVCRRITAAVQLAIDHPTWDLVVIRFPMGNCEIWDAKRYGNHEWVVYRTGKTHEEAIM